MVLVRSRLRALDLEEPVLHSWTGWFLQSLPLLNNKHPPKLPHDKTSHIYIYIYIYTCTIYTCIYIYTCKRAYVLGPYTCYLGAGGVSY